MKIEIRRSGKFSDSELLPRVERRLGFALDRFAGSLAEIRVFLQDVNGPRGGADLQCRLVARIRGLPEVVIEDIDQNLDTLLDRASERLAYNVGRRLERRRFGSPRVACDGSTSNHACV